MIALASIKNGVQMSSAGIFDTLAGMEKIT
jgi:hypothetical protein